MKIVAQIENSEGKHLVNLITNGKGQSLQISPKRDGYGSSVNGGELLFLALATCYCNDIYREAARRGVHVTRVEVEVEGEFGGPGDPAQNVRYRAKISGEAGREDLEALMRDTDLVAEIQNTLRAGISVLFAGGEVAGL